MTCGMAVAPFLSQERPGPKGGIVFVRRPGVTRKRLPRECGCSGMTVRGRLHERQAAGVWTRFAVFFWSVFPLRPATLRH